MSDPAARKLPIIEHYAAYRPRPLTPDERDSVTVLFGGLTWKHERLVQGAFHNVGYKAEPLPQVSRADLDAGKQLIDVGACCPTTFVTGNLVNFLEARREQIGRQRVVDEYVYLTAGACGACRFGQYHQSYSMALETLGLSDFRILLMAQDELDQASDSGQGLPMGLPLTMGIVWAVLCADLVSDLEYLTRPYEARPGTTDEAVRGSIELLYEAFRERPLRGGKWSAVAWHLTTRHFTRALGEVRKLWSAVEVDRLAVRPVVKITGEFWLQTHEGDGNYNIKRWLEDEGAEVRVPPIAVWLDYWMRFIVQEHEASRGLDRLAPLKARGVRLLQRVFRSAHARLRRALGGLPQELPDQYELQRLARPYFHQRLSGGEGDMLIGKALHALRHRTAHMICELNPYSCMPNTMSVGAMAQVLGDHPDLLYAPIEVKGDAEVHALSRCQMVLTDARCQAEREFENALRETGLTPERVRRWEQAHPEVRRATYRLPRAGTAGTAARLVRHAAGRGA